MGNQAAAIENFKLALKYDEQFAYARHNLAAVLLNGGDATGAIDELTKITQKRHCPADVHALLGLAYQTAGFTSKAEEQFQIVRDLASTPVRSSSP
jgi:Tfp pilus assembly protein PilF